MKSCKTCANSGVLLASGERVCRARPPVAHVAIEPTAAGLKAHTLTTWPRVAETDWCGEHKEQAP